MTVRYEPEEGCQGSVLQALRECEALLHALRDQATYASLLRQYPDHAIGITEAHAVEVGVVFEVVDGRLLATAFEREGILEA